MSRYGNPNPLIGKTLLAVYLAKDKQALRFTTTTGQEINALADGDCCSYTWIESIEGADALVGSPIVSVDDIPMPDLGDGDDECGAECIQYYGCKITTGKGDCIIDYRNASNGYYGGSLEWPDGGDGHYGGVYGQNISDFEWEKIS